MFIIFIAGASGSGKTSIASALLQDLLNADRTAKLLSMDNYFVERPPEDQDPIAYRLTTNFDRFEMIDYLLLKSHLNELSKGKPISQPIFEFESNRRIGKQTIDPAEFIIVEGMFAQVFFKEHFKDHQPSLSIFVAVSYFDLLARRVKRDEKERDRSADIVIRQERRDGGPGFFGLTAKYASGSDLHIHNDYRSDQNFTEILDEIKMSIAQVQSQRMKF